MNDFGMQDIYTLQIKRHKSANKLFSPNCEACQKGFLHVNTLQVRQFTQSGKLPGVCKSCNAAFLKICRLQIRNMTNNEAPSHVCDVCGKTFTHAGNYIKHKRLHDPAASIENFKSSLLKVENEKNFNNGMQSNEDVNVDDGKLNAEIGNSSADNVRSDVDAGNTDVDKSINADVGKPNVNAKLKLENEKSNIENAKPGNESVKSNFIKVSQKQTPPYTCNKCGKSFKKYGYYHNHCGSLCENLFCHICGKVFSSKVTLKNHVKMCETRQPMYICHYCEKSFASKLTLKTHLEDHIKHSETHSCKFCKETFAVAEQFEQHLLKHLHENTNVINEEDKDKFNHFCVECKKGFVYLGPLRNHMQTAHSGNSSFQCKTCKKIFVHSARLKKHMKLHSSKRPYSCKICSKEFVFKKSWLKHKAQHKAAS